MTLSSQRYEDMTLPAQFNEEMRLTSNEEMTLTYNAGRTLLSNVIYHAISFIFLKNFFLE